MKDIVIIGGAGPDAGIALLKQLVHVAQAQYKAWKDEDFPYVTLLSFPFSDMLTRPDCPEVQGEMASLMEEVAPEKCRFWAIACNTLHCYLKNLKLDDRFIHIMKVTEEALKHPLPLVLCTSTSKKHQIHKQFFDCVYPDDSIQKEVDQMINRLLHGEILSDFSRKIETWGLLNPEKEIVLGCTELSLLNLQHPIQGNIIDPSDLLAKKLCALHFGGN